MCAMGPFTSTSPTRPLRVGVLVDLAWTPQAGGHVKCWERFAEAAATMADALDLTVHFQGEAEAVHSIAPNVRYRLHAPVFSTRRLPFLSHVPDHTDLAPHHPRLARALAEYDVIHTTDAFFNFSKTAARVARRRGIPLVNSIHTDTPNYTRVFTAQTIHRLVGTGWLGQLLVERLRLAERAGDNMLRKLDAHQQACAFALVSQDVEYQRALQILPPERLGHLRRGIDRDAFTPAKRDRDALARRIGIPADRVLLLFAGRVNRGKNVMTLALAVRRLLDQGLPVHLLCAGHGEDRAAILELLGEHATCPGAVPQHELQVLHASADIFAFPSEYETFGNVVAEALTSGAPVVLSGKLAVSQIISADVGAVVTDSGSSEAWATALAELVADRERLAAMRIAARRKAEAVIPSWREVLEADLLPYWRAAAAREAVPCSAAAS